MTTQTGCTTVYDAIDQSVRQNEIVHLDFSETRAEILSAESEDSTESRSTAEYWGVDLDGNSWRVHLDK
jgi:hypothetical protein